MNTNDAKLSLAPLSKHPTASEAMVCQMRALIRELWPDEFAAKPELTLLQGGKGARHG